MENNLKYWENRFKFMIEEKAINSYIYLGSNDEFQVKNRPNEVLNPCNLNYIVNQISLLSGITKDNIHLYYEFMENDDLEKYNSLLDDILKDRIIKIHTFLNIDFLEFIDNYIDACFVNDNYISLSCFKIKDTLIPINEYIEQIKLSEQYKEYINNKA